MDAALVALASGAQSPHAARTAFRDARRAFKHAEAVLATYQPPFVETVNSAESQSLDDDQSAGLKTPRGFQRIEPMLFEGAAQPDTAALRAEVHAMRLHVARVRPAIASLAPSDADILAFARLELARVSTLGVAGADAMYSRDAIAESAVALRGATALVGTMTTPALHVADALWHCAARLDADTGFDTFDRFAFIRDAVNPAFDSLAAARRDLATPSKMLRKTWPDSVASVYDVAGFDVMSYAPADAPRPSDTLVARGRALFFDPALSGTHSRSCASCHIPGRGFTDGLRIAAPLRADGPRPTRHTPSLVNAALQPAQFADERRPTLESQVGEVLANPAEMDAPSGVATSREIRTAIASYERTLTNLRSRFDRALRGGATLTETEQRGFNLFEGKARCGSCHFAPLFNGTVPPDFTQSPPEVIGVPSARRETSVDDDLGRGAIDRRAGLARAFKTPTVRGAARGGPYMHNGAFATLDDVLEFYDRGGGAGLGLDVPNQTLDPRPLHLTRDEKQDLLAFLRALDPSPTSSLHP